ncbi:MAG: radical SAM family heme chaperone HemW [Cyanobacteria bacterium P01_F01_bin.150]
MVDSRIDSSLLDETNLSHVTLNNAKLNKANLNKTNLGEITLSEAASSQVSISRTEETISSAYIHIPFCRRRCFYCDFPISVVGDRPSLTPSPEISTSEAKRSDQKIADYINILCKEIKATPHDLTPSGLSTVFFGGGTPSLLEVEQLGVILQTLEQQFGIQPDAECAMEMDPGTFTLEQLQGYAALGINRASLGTQSFDNESLEACGRVHRVADIYRAIEHIHQVGIKNWSLDLISGLPYLTMEKWERSLHQAIQLQPTHISGYDLTIEPNTAFGKWYKPGASPLPTDDATADMYRMAQQLLMEAGYRHYEISNYAKPGYECRHNRVYWSNQPYYGFGLGAASYIKQQRFVRPRTRQAYAEWVNHWVTDGATSLTYDCEPTDREEQLLDTLMLGLRLAEGLSLEQLIQQFDEATVLSILKMLKPFQKQGWVDVDTCSTPQSQPVVDLEFSSSPVLPSGHIRLTDPEGFLFSNVVLSSLFEQIDS